MTEVTIDATTPGLESSHTIIGRSRTSSLRLAVSCARESQTVTAVVHARDGHSFGGQLFVRDLRRVAREVASGRPLTYAELGAVGSLTGGRLCVERTSDGVELLVTPRGHTCPDSFGPLPDAIFSVVCRDLVGWSRLVRRCCTAPRSTAVGGQK